MASYNKVNGVHVSESKELLDGVLRKEWGFDGVIM
jgi:beta-glucosidase